MPSVYTILTMVWTTVLRICIEIYKMETVDTTSLLDMNVS